MLPERDPELEEGEFIPPEDDCPPDEFEEEGIPGMPPLEPLLEELPPALPPERPELPPVLPELPPALPEEGEEVGEGMLEDEDCCSAQPPIRKALAAPTAVKRPARRASRLREQLRMLTPSILDDAHRRGRGSTVRLGG